MDSETSTAGHRNEIGGGHFWGPAVQARDVAGGIHVYQGTAAPQRMPLPRQLPPVPAHFTGRRRELAELEALRAARHRSAPQVVMVSGPGGVGKTSLVLVWLRQIAHEFPDGELYVDLGGYSPAGPMSPGSVLDRFLRALGVSSVPTETAERTALWRSMTADLRLIVMLDNAFTAAQVRPLLTGAPGSLVVITSRSRLSGLVTDGAGLHQLGMLDPASAVELLSRAIGVSRMSQDPTAARRVAERCAFLPLALSLAAAHLAARPRHPVAAVAEALARGGGPLEALKVEGETAVGTVLDASYQQLPDDAAGVYRRMGALPVAVFDLSLVTAVSGLGEEETEQLLDVLVEANLVEDLGVDAYRFHDLVRLHAARRGETDDGPEARDTTLRRFVDWCLARATSAEELLSPSHRNLARTFAHPPSVPVAFPDQETALAWLDARRFDLMAAVRLSAGKGWDASCWQLVDAMWPLFLRLRPYDLWVEAHETGLAAARRAGDRAGEGRMLTSGGNGLCNAGRAEEASAWFAEAFEHARRDGDLRQQAQALHGLGKSSLGAGSLDRARAYFARAHVLRESIGYRRGAALSRLCLGEVALTQGDVTGAVDHLTSAHAALLAEGDAYDAARALAHLGRATVGAGDYATGAGHLRRALAEFEAAGSPHWQARTLELLGQSAQDCADHAEARRCFARSLEIYEPISPADSRRLRDRLRSLDPDTRPGT
ncbi:ATP-binding protein [Streptomyces sp. XD-27]|uniref:ATP-binding protein n=1 Tax=Streptomyces sp. XD-27 TaxID=3062779 RepID=UPI0026F43F54|nr:ATP-binding protein [Streptomyces sp. XD-27]WKX68797.1 NB-ARC domain-containing protein [Streptomyces sp. XD-27]